MAGYDGWSMSNNAREAYDRGSMPISKWTKKAIIEQIEYEGIEVPSNFSKLPLELMKQRALKYDGWHHTSKFYNVTHFYELDVEYLENLTEETVEEIVEANKEAKKIQKELAAKHKRTRWIVAEYHYSEQASGAKDWSGWQIREVAAGGLLDGCFTAVWPKMGDSIPAENITIACLLESLEDAEEWNRTYYNAFRQSYDLGAEWRKGSKSHRQTTMYWDCDWTDFLLEDGKDQLVLSFCTRDDDYPIHVADEDTQIPDYYAQAGCLHGQVKVWPLDAQGSPVKEIASFCGEAVKIFRAKQFGCIVQVLDKPSDHALPAPCVETI